jgi:hypothetical protein
MAVPALELVCLFRQQYEFAVVTGGHIESRFLTIKKQIIG